MFPLRPTAGSGPGNFGVISGVATDAEGNYLVADRLRSVISVSDKIFRFVKEFGQRTGSFPGFVRPGQIEMVAGRLYVSQLASRGVSVFSVDPR